MRQQVELMQQLKETLDRILERTDWRLRNNTCKVDYNEKLECGKYTLTFPGEPANMPPVAEFQLYPMINCCGICVSTSAVVREDWQHKGLGTALNRARIEIARQLGYGLLLCTDIEKNTYQRTILARNGWQDLHSFVNPRTKNRVYVSAINL